MYYAEGATANRNFKQELFSEFSCLDAKRQSGLGYGQLLDRTEQSLNFSLKIGEQRPSFTDVLCFPERLHPFPRFP